MLFCISGNYTPKALNAMREKPTSRRAAAEQLIEAAGGKLVGMYFTMVEGPGVQVIFDADPVAAAAVTGVVASSDSIHNLRMIRLFTEDEAVAIRKKRTELHGSYRPPGQ